jgi:hypothetical protein
MASQQGFIYEQNAIAYLKKYNLSDGISAGASHTRPDLMLTVRGRKEGCELKISPTAGGSLVLKYYNKQTPHWRFGQIEHDETEKVFLRDLAITSGVLQKINQTWVNAPFLIEDRDLAHEKIMLQIPLRERYKADLQTCPDVKVPSLDSSAMSSYYNLKKTYYINIGTHGFFLLGDNDPLRLNDNLTKNGKALIPKFESVAKITARVRCQSKGVTKADAAEKSKRQIGAQGYQFTFTLEFSLPVNSSPYNIAPLAKDGKSVIILPNKEALLDCLR